MARFLAPRPGTIVWTSGVARFTLCDQRNTRFALGFDETATTKGLANPGVLCRVGRKVCPFKNI